VSAAPTVPLATDVEGQGPPLLLVHGLAEDRTFWDPLVAPLAASATVVRVDLRGHGDSPDGPGYELDDMADDVQAAFSATGLPGPPLVVGHSLGGLVSLVHAGRHPVRGLVIVDLPLTLARMQPMVQAAVAMVEREGFPAVMDAVFEYTRGAMDDGTAAALAARRRYRQEVVTATWAPYLQGTPESLAALADGIAARVGVPVLALHGLDPGPGYPAWLGERIRTATVEVWTDDLGRPLGHHLHLMAPGRFVARVQEFAATCPGSPR
jgi:pimeloyl-ACP methyl ester carboxylesterase